MSNIYQATIVGMKYTGVVPRGSIVGIDATVSSSLPGVFTADMERIWSGPLGVYDARGAVDATNGDTDDSLPVTVAGVAQIFVDTAVTVGQMICVADSGYGAYFAPGVDGRYDQVLDVEGVWIVGFALESCQANESLLINVAPQMYVKPVGRG